MLRIIFALTCLVPLPLRAIAEDKSDTDVIVYGSTPGGFCAAIAAAREGASVILLEPSEHVGGLSTGGLSHCDSNQMVRETLMGLFDEWHRRVVKDYTDRGLPSPYDATVKDQSLWTFEPHVAMRVTQRMLDEAGVKELKGRWLQTVTKDGPRITSLVTDHGTFSAKVFVDGSYEGDLMAAAGVEWTIGREGRAEFGEPLAGKKYPKKRMEIDGFDGAGKLLPLLTTNDAGADDTGDKNVMTYSFRLCLTKDPKNLIPLPAPAHYDPARFEIVRRFLKAGGSPTQVGFDLYPLPGRKLDGNNSIGKQFSIGLVGACNDWHSADKATRQKIWEEHKQYTLEFYHFLTTDPDVPAGVRKQYAELGLCRDEFNSSEHFPPALYVRESRRMKGLHVITQRDILDEPVKDDPIAISSFPIDSHDCQRVALKGGGVVNEGTIFPVRKVQPKQGYAYHVPFRAVLPQPAQCENLIVPVALSCTHVGISSLRIEGAWMVIGQGSGIAAALAAKENIAVQKVPYPKLRERLLAQGQVLALPVPSKEATAKVDGFIPTKSLPRPKPNVLLILADDLGVECLSAYGGSTHKTPNIDRLAKEGMRFTRCFSNPFCSPSRGSLLTGRYPFQNGLKVVLHSKSQENIYLKPSQPSFVRQLKHDGYATQLVGKWHVSLEHKHNTIQEFGFDHYQTWQIFDDKGEKTTRFWNPYLIRDGRILSDEIKSRYGPDVDLEVCLNFIEANARNDKPFLAYYSTCLPHYPWEPTPDSKEQTYRAPEAGHKGDPKYFPDMLAYLDKQIGSMLKTLEDLGVADNTIVLFLADNGTDRDLVHTWGDGKQVAGGKGTMTDRGTHVPLIVRWPGRIQPNSICEDLVDLSDFLPTLCELTGASLPELKIHGRSFAPQLLGKPSNPREWIHIQNAEDRQLRNSNYMLDNKNQLRRVVQLWEDAPKLNENRDREQENTARKTLQLAFEELGK